jgi:hypothetical protein
MKSDNGLFLSFDGVPRSGRTTYAQHIADVLASPDNDYRVTRVALPPAPAMRLSTAAWVAEMSEECDRIAKETILPALERGDVVIADGWITSVLLRARVSVEMKTPSIVAAWTRATRTVCPDAEYLFRDTLDAEASPITRAAADWEKLVAARGVAKFPAHPLHPRNDRRVFASSLTPDRTRRYLSMAVLSLLNARNADPGEGEMDFRDVLAESTEDRERGFAVARMTEWAKPLGRKTHGLARDPEAVEMAVMWRYWSEATREAALTVLPDDIGPWQAFRAALAAEDVSDAKVDAKCASPDEVAG